MPVCSEGTSGLGEWHLPDVGQCRAPPEAERLAQQGRGARLVAGDKRTAPLHGQPLEPVHVDVVRLDREPVARRVELDRGAGPVLVTQELAEPGDLGLEGVGGIAGRVPAIQPVDQTLRADHLARVDEQQGEQRAEPGAANGDLTSVGVPHLRRTKDAKAHDPDYGPRSPRWPGPARPHRRP